MATVAEIAHHLLFFLCILLHVSSVCPTEPTALPLRPRLLVLVVQHVSIVQLVLLPWCEFVCMHGSRIVS